MRSQQYVLLQGDGKAGHTESQSRHACIQAFLRAPVLRGWVRGKRGRRGFGKHLPGTFAAYAHLSPAWAFQRWEGLQPCDSWKCGDALGTFTKSAPSARFQPAATLAAKRLEEKNVECLFIVQVTFYSLLMQQNSGAGPVSALVPAKAMPRTVWYLLPTSQGAAGLPLSSFSAVRLWGGRDPYAQDRASCKPQEEFCVAGRDSQLQRVMFTSSRNLFAFSTG